MDTFLSTAQTCDKAAIYDGTSNARRCLLHLSVKIVALYVIGNTDAQEFYSWAVRFINDVEKCLVRLNGRTATLSGSTAKK